MPGERRAHCALARMGARHWVEQETGPEGGRAVKVARTTVGDQAMGGGVGGLWMNSTTELRGSLGKCAAGRIGGMNTANEGRPAGMLQLCRQSSPAAFFSGQLGQPGQSSPRVSATITPMGIDSVFATDIFIDIGFIGIAIDAIGIDAIDIDGVGTLPHTPPIPCAKRARQSTRWPRRRSMTIPDYLFFRYFQAKPGDTPGFPHSKFPRKPPLRPAWIGRFVHKRTDCRAWRTAA